MDDEKIKILRRFGLHASADELERKAAQRRPKRVRCSCKPPAICPACVPQVYEGKPKK